MMGQRGSGVRHPSPGRERKESTMEKSDTASANTAPKPAKKKREFPHILVVLLIAILVAAICTYIVPAGQYTRVIDEASGREVVDPNSFQYVEQTPVGLFGMFLAIEEGLISATDITFMILAAFSCLHVLEKTGAIDAAIAAMVKKTKSRPQAANIIIACLMALLTIWGSTGTLSYEEIIAFAPIFVAVSMALGYDAMVGVGISVIPVGIGFAAATVNPFSIGVAQTIAELPMFSGIWYRVLILVVMTAFTIFYVLRYAAKVRKDPTYSIVHGIDYSDLAVDETRLNTPFTLARKLSIAALFVGVGVMAWGLISQGWYINQVTAVFLMVSVAVGIINRWSASKTASTLVEGLQGGVLSAIVVGVARGILQVVTKGHILDTIIHSCVAVLENLSLYLSGFGMLVFQTFLNLLIPSGSGQAAVSMPIMTPIADLIGMNRQIAVLIFQFGDGFSNLLWPTGFMMIVCAMVKIPLNKYYKWLLPFFGILFVLQVLFVFGAIAIGYGPM